ncbi:MAG TPA: DUF2442 domain-containing protein [Bacteroidia bacterium]|nr:DUF2442 domain-containing protein [Bacteroidia bacterium]
MPKTYPAVKKVKPTDDYKLILTFSNGETRLFDMKPYLGKGVFLELLSLSLFRTAHVSFDTVEWDNKADFDPEVLYKLGKKIKQNKNSVSPSIASAAEPGVKYNRK